MDWSSLITPENVEIGILVALIVASHMLRNKAAGIVLRRTVVDMLTSEKGKRASLSDIALSSAATFSEVSGVKRDVMNEAAAKDGVLGISNKKKAQKILTKIFTGWLSSKIERG